MSPLGKSSLTLSYCTPYAPRTAPTVRDYSDLYGSIGPRRMTFLRRCSHILARGYCHLPTFWVLIKVGVGSEQNVDSAGTGVEKSRDENMKRGKSELFCAAERLLPVGVVLVVLFWAIACVSPTRIPRMAVAGKWWLRCISGWAASTTR